MLWPTVIAAQWLTPRGGVATTSAGPAELNNGSGGWRS